MSLKICSNFLHFFNSTHGILWESVSQFTNALSYVDIDNLHDENGKK